ncbi:ATP-binding protein [Nocardiopsis aegyptia]|uniref:Anti-sigma regulatory factor (Ser/Thr protein kinase) n=1 Tax=Nocardiopsis aegyptia TaxID=220378 RepID=A0A7Z0EKC9_9ACTN|nr:ATP-binding protein [Nocardiopsis aegyptia]NYJ32845.1 anti-sigma regulatory factor (Ser/Thr protein kinase) [Nocardiopsis aegyptia]
MIATGPHTDTVTARHTFPGVATSLTQARAWAGARLTDQGVDVPDDLPLVLTELATNAIRHTRSSDPGGTFTVRLILGPKRVRVEVRDNGPRGHHTPAVRPWSPTAVSGRGLAIVEAFSASWGPLPVVSGVFAEVAR